MCLIAVTIGNNLAEIDNAVAKAKAMDNGKLTT
jgi:hypothetical protein